MTKYALLTVLVFASLSTTVADTTGDIARLVGELGAHATPELVADLGLSGLLPENGVHEPLLFWHEDNGRISLAVVVPTAVRVGHKLLDLEELGVVFSESFTTRRIRNATEMWTALEKSAEFFERIKQVEQAIGVPTTRRAPPGSVSDPLGLLAVSEVSGPLVRDEYVPQSDPTPGPKPGEVQCFLLYKISPYPGGGWLCKGTGQDCWIKTKCPGSKKKVELQP